MMKGEYEIGIHTMRALALKCIEDGEVILLIDFSNAFDSCNRNLLVKLVAAGVPEISTLAFGYTRMKPSYSFQMETNSFHLKGCTKDVALQTFSLRY